MNKFSEFEMGCAFEKALLDGKILSSHQFTVLAKEITSQQGIPDFVAMKQIDDADYTHYLSENLQVSCKILACLKYFSGRRYEYIRKKTVLADPILKRTLNDLINKNFISKEKQLYFLNEQDKFNIDIWAFELKLDDWKRALFQALQYKAFASHSIVVFPDWKEDILKKNIHIFKNLNVGVLIFNNDKLKTKWINRPKKKQPISKWQQLYMFFKLLNASNQK